jgi:hypothetical protein
VTQQRDGGFGVAEGFPREVEQVLVGLDASGLALAVQDLHLPPLRAPHATLEGDTEALTGVSEDPREGADAVEEERVIRGMVDVGLGDGGIDAHLAAVLDALAFGMADDDAVDLFPSLRGDPLDVVGERRLPGNLKGVREAAEAHIAAGVSEVEGELLVAEAVRLLDDGSAQHLLGREAGTSRTPGPVSLQVFPDQLRDARICHKDPVDGFQLPRVFVRQSGGVEIQPR